MWKHHQSGRGFVFADPLRLGTSRIVVSGRNWVEAATAFVRLVDPEEREVPLIAVGRDLHGAADLSGRGGAQLRIETSSPPPQLAIWSHSRPHSSDLWRRVLPTSLSGGIGEIQGVNHSDPAALVESFASAALSDSVAEIALASLEGPIQADAITAAVALLRHLADHPLHRSNKLGALIAALCQKQGTP
jgi:hypothetical protein